MLPSLPRVWRAHFCALDYSHEMARRYRPGLGWIGTGRRIGVCGEAASGLRGSGLENGEEERKKGWRFLFVSPGRGERDSAGLRGSCTDGWMGR